MEKDIESYTKLNFCIPKKQAAEPPENDWDEESNNQNSDFYKKHEEEFYGYVSEPREEAKRSILIKPKEKKKPEKRKIKDDETLKSDLSLPNELREMFEPFNCKLCSADLPSTVSARIHYKSNSHAKQIRNWLIKYSEQTGEPLHKRATIVEEKKEEDNDPKYFRCTTCDIPLLGKLHAESHYMGKNHLKALRGHVPVKKKSQTSENFFCEICSVHATSASQFQTHLDGQKHLKKVKAANAQSLETQNQNGVLNCGLCSISFSSKEDLEIHLRSHQQLAPPQDDDFSCGLCSITANSKEQLDAHLRSKKHLRKLIE